MASNKKDLKAYFRYDGTGRAVAGSLILNRFKPKVGNWGQTNAYECCDPSCLPIVYGEDCIIDNIVPYGMDQAAIIVLLNPMENIVIQGGLFSCDDKVMNVSPELTILFPGQNLWIVPANDLFTACSIKFRRICFNGNGHSNWSEPIN